MSHQHEMEQQQNEARAYGRREFLKMSALIAGWAVLETQVGAGVWATREAQAAEMVPEGINHMTAYEYKVMKRLQDVMLPLDGTPFPNDVPVLQVLDAALLAGMPPHILSGLKGGIQYFDAGPKKHFKGRHFTDLTDEEAVEFLARWSDGEAPPHRGLAMGLKKLIGLSYWSNPATWPSLGYGGPYSKRAGVELLGNAPRPS